MIEKLLEYLLYRWQNREVLKLGGASRSSEWPKTKREFEKIHPKECSVCMNKNFIQLHHVKPFNQRPDLENDLENLIWLCEAPNRNCHLNMGHLNFFGSWNESIKEDSKIWNTKIQQRP